MQTCVTSNGSNLLANALATGTPMELTGFRAGSSIISSYTMAELQALTDVVDDVYSTTTPEITYTIQNSNAIVFRLVLDITVGNFDIGNYGLYDTHGNLILLVALDGVLPKYNTTSPSGANQIELYPTMVYENVVQAVNLSIYITNNASLPTVANVSALPVAGTTEYNAYIVLSDTNTDEEPSIYVSNGNAWFGLMSQSYSVVSQYLTASETITPKGFRNFYYNNSTSATTLNLTIGSGLFIGQEIVVYGNKTATVNTQFTGSFLMVNGALNTTFAITGGPGVAARFIWDGGSTWRVEEILPYVQMGTGIGQSANQVKIGWSTSGLLLTVDTTAEGNFILSTTPLGGSLAGELPNATLAPTGVTLGTYNLLSASIGADGRVISASSASSINVTGAIISSGSYLYGATFIETGPAGYINVGTGQSTFGGPINIQGLVQLAGGLQIANDRDLEFIGGDNGIIFATGVTNITQNIVSSHLLSTDATGSANIGTGGLTVNGTAYITGQITSPGGANFGGAALTAGNASLSGSVTAAAGGVFKGFPPVLNNGPGGDIVMGYENIIPYVALSVGGTVFGTIITNNAAFWPFDGNTEGWAGFPGSGMRIHWGTGTTETGSVRNVQNLAVAFPNVCLFITGNFASNLPPTDGAIGFDVANAAQFFVCDTSVSGHVHGFWYIAIGY